MDGFIGGPTAERRAINPALTPKSIASDWGPLYEELAADYTSRLPRGFADTSVLRVFLGGIAMGLHGTTQLLREAGAGARMEAEGHTHDGCYLAHDWPLRM